MAPLASEKYMALVGMLTLETAGLLLVARVFKAGFLADFLSRTVLVGFLTGVGVQVGVAMLGDMLGVKVELDAHARPTLGACGQGARRRTAALWASRSSRRRAFSSAAGSRPAFRFRLSWLSA